MKTVKGRVVYNRKQHPFRITDVLRIMRGVASRKLRIIGVDVERETEFLGRIHDFIFEGFLDGVLFPDSPGTKSLVLETMSQVVTHEGEIQIIAFIIEG